MKNFLKTILYTIILYLALWLLSEIIFRLLMIPFFSATEVFANLHWFWHIVIFFVATNILIFGVSFSLPIIPGIAILINKFFPKNIFKTIITYLLSILFIIATLWQLWSFNFEGFWFSMLGIFISVLIILLYSIFIVFAHVDSDEL